MPYVLYETPNPAVAHIRLNRPERLNAFSPPVERELLETVQRAASDPRIRVMIFSGEGRSFSAGWDLKEGAETDPNGRPLEVRMGQNPWLQTIRLLRRPDKLSIAAVHGYAAGQGVELCIACDFIVCAESARFYFAETRVGFNMTSGVSKLLPMLVGLAHARRLALLGQEIDGAEAGRLGLAVRVMPEGEHVAGALELAAEALRGAPLAVAAQKRLFDLGLGTSLYDIQDVEVQASERLMLSEDAREAARAFAEKRDPVFGGW